MEALFSGFDIEERDFISLEEQIGIDPRGVIDRTEKGVLTDREAENVVRYLDGEKVLQNSSELSEGQLAHESVHAAMMDDENGEIRLFGEDKFDWRLYAEFAAYMAQDIVEGVNIGGGDKIEYFVSRKAYMDAHEEAVENGLPDVDSLYQEFLEADRIEDERVKQGFLETIQNYRDSREQTLAAYAAKNFRDQNDVELQEIINPDKQTYDEVIKYIKQSEEGLLGG